MPSDGSSNKRVMRWGILAPGGIAETFVGDLQLDPATRGVTDVAHRVVAVGSASGQKKADDFVKRMYTTKEQVEEAKAIRTYGSYDELVRDADVEIMYIASPQSHHYQQIKLCLNAGKHVLCEKPITINAEQIRKLSALSKAKNLFFMEARWTKFMDIFREIVKLVHEDKILGHVYRVHSDFGQELPEDHRLYFPELGGGGLLDCGIYPLTYLTALLWDHPDNQRARPRVTGSMRISPKFKVDEDSTGVLQFDKINATGILTVNMRVDLHRPAFHTIIQGDKGDILVHGTHTSRPTAYSIVLKGQKPVTKEPHIPGHGFFWEADECARCIVAGKLESPVVSHEESIFAMEIMDEIRKQGGLQFPEQIERAD
ncbi:uncharacterized protein PFL1_05675 [Pseudozyma flocculosa PF-1]|uniref:D-xylose 1-dehydrogenase (NADP(+), D-xylono-1,5-lactone-forming) n=2 Tax=Pseudozyma flocculosa TaxID=84751 RepID=A0A5C3F946_9BASI|nr:uncharacterized protein PFL1_05675 [Pseudozyma flocculosa PF-1]EPQ26696.1 hypothetical protein PFL1_05675 [Pseudozyma flocculosa PF-1]SPO40984.1 related to dimeric dihydrodiol dehydrogenase [Pseudozyma flocculosa]